MEIAVKIILHHHSLKSQNGVIFERLMGEVFRHQGYILGNNINFTGLEVDLIGKHLYRSETLYVECKAKKKPKSNEIRIFVFNVKHKKADHGYFVYTEQLDHQAEGLRSEIEEDKVRYNNITFFGPDKIIKSLENSNVISPLIPPAKRIWTKKILCYTYFGIYYILISGDLTVKKYFHIYDKDGNQFMDINKIADEDYEPSITIKQALERAIPELKELQIEFDSHGSINEVLENHSISNSETDNYKHTVYVKLGSYLDRKFKETDGKLTIFATDFENKNKNTLSLHYRNWLKSKNRILVLLGAAGSGKSLSLKELHWDISNKHNQEFENTISVYIDLARFTSIDNFFELISLSFRQYELEINENRFIAIHDKFEILIILDSFDEYDQGGFSGISSRFYDNFDIFSKANCKIIFGCRNHYFRSLSVVRKYSASGSDTEIIPEDALILRVKDLDTLQINKKLLSYKRRIKNLTKALEFVTTPLAIFMFLKIIKYDNIKFFPSLESRWDLYNKYLIGLFAWDKKSRDKRFSIDLQEKFYLLFSELILLTGESSINYETVTSLINKMKPSDHINDIEDYAVFFRKSSILEEDSGGKLRFRHKTFREFLVAKSIYIDIELDNRNFEFRWFTRDERAFIAERLRPKDIETLISWAADSEHYIAQNYACFILGSQEIGKYYEKLMLVFEECEDLLLRINIVNVLAPSKENWVRDYLIKVIKGYCIETGLIEKYNEDQLGMAGKTANFILLKYNRNVMRIHISESIEAVTYFQSEDIDELILNLANNDSSIVGDEARTITKVKKP